MTDAERMTACWCRVTPTRVVLVLFVMEVFIALSQHYGWFPFNEYDTCALLIALSLAGATTGTLVIWLLATLILRRQFLFTLRLLCLLVAMLAVPCGWLSLEVSRERAESQAALAIRQIGGKALARPTLLGWLLRDDSLVSVWYVDFRGTAAGDQALANVGCLHELSVLYASSRTTDAGLVHLRRLTHLVSLGLGRSKITDAGLVNIEGLNRLDSLWLGETRVTDGGLAHLCGLTRLSDLGLNGTRVTPGGLRRLQKALPGCQFWVVLDQGNGKRDGCHGPRELDNRRGEEQDTAE
jgi:hypothetical protein